MATRGVSGVQTYTPKDFVIDNTGDHLSGDPSSRAMVRAPGITVSQYLQEQFPHRSLSVSGKHLRDQLVRVGNQYNNSILHEIRGDGNCLTTSFATSLMYNMIGNFRLIEKVTNEILKLAQNRDLANEIKEVLGGIQALKENSSLVLNQWLTNNSFMKSFSYILRILVNESFRQDTEYQSLADQIVPVEDGENIDMYAILRLSRIFDLQAHVFIADATSINLSIQKSHEDSKLPPDIVIIRKAAHFLSLIPEHVQNKIQATSRKVSSSAAAAARPLGDRADRLGEVELEALLRSGFFSSSVVASAAPSDRRPASGVESKNSRAVRPARQSRCTRVAQMVAVSVILGLGIYLRSILSGS